MGRHDFETLTHAQYGYLGALVACFIFGMGNRPQGSACSPSSRCTPCADLQLAMEIQNHHILLCGTDHIVSERLSVSNLTHSMLVCAILCVVQAVQNIDQPIFARMLVSLASTYGIYIVSSIMALDPW